MEKSRLDEEVSRRGLTISRSQAENLIRLGHVKVASAIIRKPSFKVSKTDRIQVDATNQFVSRAALKLKSAAEYFGLDFKNAVALDVGISTGGFTDYMLVNGAQKVVGVEVGTNQLHPTLHDDPRIELHEKTDIRNYTNPHNLRFTHAVIDVSFISMRDVLPHIMSLTTKQTLVVAMLKPQFEAGDKKKHKGVIKNSKMRRQILQDFEIWVKDHAVIQDKKDSDVSGKKGNVERFYLLTSL